MAAVSREFEERAARDGFVRVAGIDEAGRGPLAGPVVAAAVILPDGRGLERFDCRGIADSKKLTAERREALYPRIHEMAVAVAVGVVEAGEIDRINVLRATLLAMRLAVEKIAPPPDCLLIDGNARAPIAIPQQTIVGGDGLCLSIAAASIIAKVTRDRLMLRHHEDYPLYGFSMNKGYPTQAHRDAIRRHGCCPIHRRTFRGVREFISPAQLDLC